MAVELAGFKDGGFLVMFALSARAPELAAVLLGLSFLVGPCLRLACRAQVDDLAHGYFLRNASSETTSAPPLGSPSAVSVVAVFLLRVFFGFSVVSAASASRGWNSCTGDSLATAGLTSSNSISKFACGS